MTSHDPRTELQAVAHPAVRVVAEILSARLDMERWERDGWPTVDDDLAAAVAPAFLRWIAGQFEARGRRQAVGGGHPAHLTTVASGWYAAAALAGMWADEIGDAIDAEAARRALADPAPSIPLDEVLAAYIPGPATQTFRRVSTWEMAWQSPVPPAAHPSTTDGSLITPAEVAAYERGVADGRAAAAADIRAEAGNTAAVEGGPDLMRYAAEIAEGNTDA